MSKGNQQATVSTRQPCRVETLAREAFLAILANTSGSTTNEHLARLAIEAAEDFYEAWDNRGAESHG